MAKDTGKKLADMMYGGNPEQAAFGVFPQMKPRRTRQDPEAAKNVPVDLLRGAVSGVLGAPGDIESLIRLLPGLDENTVLPTSEDIEKRLPFKSDTPVSRAATGLGQIGGGFYTGPGSPFRLVGSIPGALKHGAQEFAKASAGSASHVIKPKGGNWMSGSVEKALKRLKSPYDPDVGLEDLRQMREQHGELPAYARDEQTMLQAKALNNWVDRNLTNYVKKEMATPEDPVRKLADEGILHFQPQDVYLSPDTGFTRTEAGYPRHGMGKSQLAIDWEALSDKPVGFGTAGEMINIGKGEPWMEKVDPFTRVHGIAPMEQGSMARDLGFDHILDVLREDLASGRIRPEQLNKVSMEQAVRRTYEYDQEMAKKMREAQIKATEGMPVYKEYPEGFKWVELKAKEPESLPEGVKRVQQSVTQGGLDVPGVGYIPAKWNPEKGLDWEQAERDARKALSYEPTEKALKYEGETMGHCVGGYCPDVVEGRSRIFSLRDAKGEPHVTIEVEPAPRIGFREGEGPKTPEERFDLQTEWLKGVESGKIGGDVTFANWWRQKNNIPEPELPFQISQIKGKQNRAPVDEYLPFVQDFVKSGQWSDVGDLQNTGLIRRGNVFTPTEKQGLIDLGQDVPEYLTQEDIARLRRARGDLPPEDGMAEGGQVIISDNPDVMQMELAGGGLVKGLVKAVKGTQEVLPAAEREVNKAKFLEPSKVKDRLYHGTGDDITEFRPSRIGAMGPGTYLTKDPSVASGYSDVTTRRGSANQPNVLPVFSQIKNPFNISSVNESNKELFKYFDPTGKLTDDEVIELVKKAGYDAIQALKEGEINVLNPKQIKSAIGNRGTYDVTDPDITKAEGGEVHMDEGGAAFGQYTAGKKYQAAKRRAENADVNLLPDPKTYAVVQGLLGTAPDEMGFSVLHPKYQEIKEVADPAFAVGTTLQVMPAAKPGALALARKGERLAERVVPGIMERGGLPADILSGLTQGSASYAYRPHTPLKPDPDVGTRYKKQFIGGLVPRQDLDIESLEKSSAKIFPWDATSRNQLITEVSDVPLTKPVLTEGGDEYMMDVGHVANRIAGASNIEIAKRIKDRIDQAAVENQLLGGTGKVYGFPVRMGERAEHFSTFPADIAMDLMKQAGLKKKELKELTDDLKTMVFEGKPGYFKNIAPVGTPEFEQQLREGLAKTKTEKGKDVTGFTAGNLRKGLMDRLGKVEYQKRLGYNLPDLTGAVLSDVLKGVPKGYVGNVAAELDPFTALRPSKSSSYSHDFSGQYVGSMPNMPVEFLMPNTFESYYRHFKKEYPSANEGALRNMAIGAMEKRKESISEMIGPRSVDAVKTYQEGLMKGEFDPNDIKQVYDYMRRKKLQLKMAKGGKVKKDEHKVQNPVHFTENPDAMRLALTKRN